jgi:hypothetical protein
MRRITSYIWFNSASYWVACMSCRRQERSVGRGVLVCLNFGPVGCFAVCTHMDRSVVVRAAASCAAVVCSTSKARAEGTLLQRLQSS